MAREIVTWCDVHMAEHDAREAGKSIEVTVDGRTLVLDLCEGDEKAILGPVREAMDAYGRRPDQGQPMTPDRKRTKRADAMDADLDPTVMTCPVDLCGRRFKAASISSHFTQVHPDLQLARWKFEHGEIERIYECQEKGCKQAYEKRQGLQMHYTRTHNKDMPEDV